jgi:predicted DNA repair protein MutK
MTIGVYGLVAAIVKFDDLGLWLMQKPGVFSTVGQGFVSAAPLIMKFLGVAGTIAMFLVGGGILAHGIAGIHHWQEELHWSLALVVDLTLGILAGFLVVLAKKALSLFRAKVPAA